METGKGRSACADLLDVIRQGLLDALTRLRFWEDDSQVAQKRTVKAWGPKPFLEINVREIAGKGGAA